MKLALCSVTSPGVVEDEFRVPGIPFTIPLSRAVNQKYRDFLQVLNTFDSEDLSPAAHLKAGTTDLTEVQRRDRMQRKSRRRGWVE